VEQAVEDNLKLAIGAILLACLALSLGDALIRQSSASFPIWQIFVLRSMIVAPLLIYILRIRDCATPIRPLHPGWALLRSLILVVMWIFYFAALPQMALATAAAAYYTLPIFIILLAAIFLGESMTPSSWMAVVLGFGGTILILEPRAGDFDAYSLLPIAAAICYAGAMTLTRSKCRGEKPLVLSLWLNLCFISVGALATLILSVWQPGTDMVALNPFLLDSWTPMGLGEWRVMAILAGAILVGSLFAAIAYQNGPSSVIAIFDFSYLGFAVLWGLLLFAEVPGARATLGMLLIVIAGIIATRQRSP
jgi:drug/metabolite transporter (DMT)-like permease